MIANYELWSANAMRSMICELCALKNPKANLEELRRNA